MNPVVVSRHADSIFFEQVVQMCDGFADGQDEVATINSTFEQGRESIYCSARLRAMLFEFLEGLFMFRNECCEPTVCSAKRLAMSG